MPFSVYDTKACHLSMQDRIDKKGSQGKLINKPAPLTVCQTRQEADLFAQSYIEIHRETYLHIVEDNHVIESLHNVKHHQREYYKQRALVLLTGLGIYLITALIGTAILGHFKSTMTIFAIAVAFWLVSALWGICNEIEGLLLGEVALILMLMGLSSAIDERQKQRDQQQLKPPSQTAPAAPSSISPLPSL